ncbi:MAG: cellulase N-terminal Ig-like domain-containing protein, partial [Candidatus Cloacimonadaceae bacterium]
MNISGKEGDLLPLFLLKDDDMRIFSRKLLLLLLFQLFSFHAFTQNSWIRVNQVGFLEEDVKVAVWISKEERTPDQFELTDAITGNVVYHGEKV